ncbi:IS110 family transposase [Acidisphaera sp. L21]|uniref:IS110 family transposase n=1 Tax=Acidisphaera sp. L21 TaxID=1641851 RepID=UPI0020B14834|nr:IS110 family transposase [Acidisphaera sp. L21]
MPNIEHSTQAAAPADATTIDMDATLFVALELSLSSWLAVASAPGEDKASKHGIAACDGPGLLSVLKRLQERAERRLGHPVEVLVMQEAGRDGFWVHRWLEAHAVRSVVVDPASIAVNRRSRRAKTDRIDAEAMLRTLMAWSRGERQVCAMVRPPSREAEDARRLNREREALLAERIRHANRIKGLLATQRVFGFEPTLRDRRARLADVRTPEGDLLPPRLMAEIRRQMDRLELTMAQLGAVEADRDAVFKAERAVLAVPSPVAERASGEETPAAPRPLNEGPGARLLRLKGVGPETASVLAGEAFFRDFRNRREVASYAGLTPSPWQSGGIDHEQGISKAGNARVRKTMGQLAWLWLRNQPASALSAWYRDRVRDGKGRNKRIAITALARKLLVALWRFVTHGLVPTGAMLKPTKAG